jgi:channel protein (hemolysin III family)
VGLLPFALLYACLPPRAWGLLAAGGVIFSLGTLLYLRDRVGNPHSLKGWWYVLVVVASTVHYVAVLNYVAPPGEACVAATAERGLAAWARAG